MRAIAVVSDVIYTYNQKAISMTEFQAVDISSTAQSGAQVPNFQAVFESWGLYDPATAWDQDGNRALAVWVWSALADQHVVDIFCPSCSNLSVFTSPGNPALAGYRTSDNAPVRYDFGRKYEEIIPIKFTCARNATHLAHVQILLRRGFGIIKVGQYPSLADVAMRELDSYAKLLGNDRLRELKRGIGLRAHGIGIGSIVYLRRVLEFIVERAETEYVAANGAFDSKAFRMQDKIKFLQDFLPSFIVDNRKLYGVLSDGVHNRSDEDCNALFAPCYAGILIALAQLEAKRAESERAANAKTELERVATLIAGIKD